MLVYEEALRSACVCCVRVHWGFIVEWLTCLHCMYYCNIYSNNRSLGIGALHAGLSLGIAALHADSVERGAV